MKCELCDEFGDQLTLAGVVTARLCTEHRIAFDSAAWEWPGLDEWRVKQARRAAVTQVGNEERVASLTLDMIQIDRETRKRTLAWLAEHKAKPEPE